MTAPISNLRAHLRKATATAHDVLDDSMRSAAGWSNINDYAAFLGLQYQARLSVEEWLENEAPKAIKPPLQTGLIEQDLNALHVEVPPIRDMVSPAFEAHSNTHSALGVAWALAGSSLGNRIILKEISRIAKTDDSSPFPCAFLSDAGMFAFWQELRPRIEAPASPVQGEQACKAAMEVFAHFTRVTQTAAIAPDSQSAGVQDASHQRAAPV